MSAARLPLAGLTVADFSQGAAGPYGAMLLGDLGADVVKIEPPAGDWARTVGTAAAPGQSSAFLSVNRNKRSVVLDLKTEAGRAAAQAIVDRAGIVVHNYRRGVMERLGFDYPTLSRHNPAMIYATVYGFGPEGPCADLPAGDSIMQAYAGLMSINGDVDTPPLRVGNVVSDMLAGMFLAQGVLAALLSARETGRGQALSVSLLDAMAAFQAPTLTEYWITGTLPARNGREHPLVSPSGTFETADGHVVMSVLQHQWVGFCERLAGTDLLADERFASNESRIRHRVALMRQLRPRLRALPTAEVLRIMRVFDVVCAPVNDYAALEREDQVQVNELFRRFGPEHRIPFVRNPVRYGGFAPSYQPPPELGAQTREFARAAAPMEDHAS